MDKEKEPETTWERVSNLSLPNQVRVLCDCLDEIKDQVSDMDNSITRRIDNPDPKPPKK